MAITAILIITASSRMLLRNLLNARHLPDLISWILTEVPWFSRDAISQGHVARRWQCRDLTLAGWPRASARNLRPGTAGLLPCAGGRAWCHQLWADSRALPMMMPRLPGPLGVEGLVPEGLVTWGPVTLKIASRPAQKSPPALQSPGAWSRCLCWEQTGTPWPSLATAGAAMPCLMPAVTGAERKTEETNSGGRPGPT